MNLSLPKSELINGTIVISEQLLDYYIHKNIYIVGGNGAGKSRLGLFIESKLKQSGIRVTRISAQKVLSIPVESVVRSVASIDSELQSNQNRFLNFHTNYDDNNVTTIVNDFTQVVAKLFSLKANRDAKFYDDFKNNVTDLINTPTAIDIIEKIWADIFPHRQLVFSDSKIQASYYNPTNCYLYNYSANEMSDGERVVLYLLAHAFTAPSYSVLIFDEPESHLHKSLLNRIWSKLEEHCLDKRLIVITHDLDLVASRENAFKIWIKEYLGGNAWNWELIPTSGEIPESLFLELLGTRKKILFVEGIENGDDHKLFQQIYDDYQVIPCGSCEKVINMTKSLNNNSFWKSYKSPAFYAKGLIDRDIKSDVDVKNLKEDNIEVMNVAELENLLCIPSVFKIAAIHQGFSDVDLLYQTSENKIKDFLKNHLMNEAYANMKLNLENKFKELRKLKVTEFSTQFAKEFASIDVKVKLQESRADYAASLESSSLEDILKKFNNKGIVKQIDQVIRIDYKDLILRLVSTKGEVRDNIIQALKSSLPPL